MAKNEHKILFHRKDSNNATHLLNKWDKLLTDYENYLKEYLENYKKSLKGCRLSLTKYPYMKEKSNVLKKKLNKANKKGLLTTKQLARVIKVKLTAANASLTQK